MSARTARPVSAICCGVRYAAPTEPSAPASQTAATSRGVSPPPAIGAWMIGWLSLKRFIRSVPMDIALSSSLRSSLRALEVSGQRKMLE